MRISGQPISADEAGVLAARTQLIASRGISGGIAPFLRIAKGLSLPAALVDGSGSLAMLVATPARLLVPNRNQPQILGRIVGAHLSSDETRDVLFVGSTIRLPNHS